MCGPHSGNFPGVRLHTLRLVRFQFPLAALGVAAHSIAFADGPNAPIPATPLANPPVIDGRIDESEWCLAGKFQGLRDSDTGTPIDEDGEFWLASDSQFIYFAARLKDAEPGRIQATEYRTNVSLSGNDSVTLQIDPFGNLAEFSSFSINPRGATNISIAGGRAAKREWLGEFTARARITESGWEAEARIPWSVLRLPQPGSRTVRFNVLRNFTRRQRSYRWADTNGGQVENYGRWEGVQIPPGAPRTLKLLPYAYAGFDKDDGAIFNSGLDMRTSLTDQMDLVGSINPDFRNVENQVLSLDFSYFERLRGETRPFFLEGSDFFRTSGDAPIFTSQRIASFDTGVKAFGRLSDRLSLGVLNTTTFGEENALVGRVNYNPRDRHSYSLAFAGLDTPERSNQAYFASFGIGSGPIEYFGQVSGTQDRQQGTGGRMNFGAYYGRDGMDAVVEYFQVTNDFLPRLGFVSDRGLAGFSGFVGVERPTTKGGLVETEWGVGGNISNDLDGKPYRRSAFVNGSATYGNGLDFDFFSEYSQFRGNDDVVVGLGVEKPRSDGYRRWSVNYAGGRLAGEPYQNFSASVAYRPVNALQLNASYQRVRVLGEDEEQTILSANWDIGNDRSVSGRLVQRGGDSNPYLAFRQSGNRGAEYFLIVGDPNADTFRTSIILKATFPFELRI